MNKVLLVPALAIALLPKQALASCHGGGGLANPLAFCSIGEFLFALLGLVIQIGFPIIVLFIVFIGFQFVRHSAEGNSEELAKDRTNLLWALVGALILLGAQALAIAIQATVANL